MKQSPAINCRQAALEALLRGDEASDEFHLAASHVESCQRCQSELSELAADEISWREVRDVLGSRAELSLTRSSGDPVPTQSPVAAARHADIVQLLDVASHPEMLGRLGRYDIERVIGSGGMGVVLKAHDSELNRPVAIKVLAPHLAHSAAARQRFAREGRAAAAVVHEHVIAIHNVEPDTRRPFLVMQYIPGRSLEERVRGDGPLALNEILRIGMQTAAGLAAAHAQGVVHRDVKPSNILLENSVERAVLTDFGLARAADDATLTGSGILAGTPHYMSPEQAQGDAVDHRADLFSLGAVLYFMAAGHPPFRADGTMAVLQRICRDRPRPLWQINPDIPDAFCDVVERLLAKKPSARYASAAEVSRDLSRLLSRSQEPRRFRLCGRWRRRLRCHRAEVTAAAGVIAIATVSAALYRGGWFSDGGALPNSVGPPSGARSDVAADADAFTAREARLADGLLRHDSFASDMAEIQQELAQFEAQTSSDRTAFLMQHGDTWTAELSAIQRELARAESKFTDDFQTSGDEK